MIMWFVYDLNSSKLKDLWNFWKNMEYKFHQITNYQLLKNIIKTCDGDYIDIFKEIYEQRTAFNTTYEIIGAVQVFLCSP